MGFPRYSLWGERRRAPGDQRGLRGTPRSHTTSLRTPHSPSTTHNAPASTVPASTGAPHTSATAQSPVTSWCHPPLSSSMCMRCHAQGTCAGCSAWDTPPAPGCRGAMLRPGHGAPVRHAGGVPGGPGEPSQARRGKAGSRREPAQPEGLGVCRARCVLGGPGGTYPAPVPTQRGAGRPAGARARSVCTAPRFSPPRATSTACGMGHCGEIRLGLKAPAELSRGRDVQQRWGSLSQGMHRAQHRSWFYPAGAFQALKSYPCPLHTALPRPPSPALAETTHAPCPEPRHPCPPPLQCPAPTLGTASPT